jgi:hypothetical protein
VCSHRGNASELQAGGPDGGLVHSAMPLLWARGVRCFDLDVVQLRCGTLVVGHPAAMAAAVNAAAAAASAGAAAGPAAAGQPSQRPVAPDEVAAAFDLPQLTSSLGPQAVAFPELRDVMAVFARLSAAAAAPAARDWVRSRSSRSGAGADGSGPALLMLELKGRADGSVEAHAVASMAAAAGVAGSVMLWHVPRASAATPDVEARREALKREVRAAADVVRAVRARAAGVLAGISLRDNAPLSLPAGTRQRRERRAAAGTLLGGVPPEQLAAFDILAPSVALPDAALEVLAAHGPTIGWVVNGADALGRALALGLDGVISDEPVAALAELARLDGAACQAAA